MCLFRTQVFSNSMLHSRWKRTSRGMLIEKHQREVVLKCRDLQENRCICTASSCSMRVQYFMLFEIYSLFNYRLCHQSATNHLIKNHITAQHIINALLRIIFSVRITVHVRLLTCPSKKKC
jgi:hypothetical protein